MAIINFPNLPATGTVYSFGTKSWIFNGIGWQAGASTGGGVVITPPVEITTNLDATTLTEYQAAIGAAAMGSKRLAGATALVNAMKPNHRLYIYRDDVLIIPISFTGDMTISSGTDITIAPGTMGSANPLQTADLATGTWTFQLQGGSSFTRIISGSVGGAGSGKDLILSESPKAGFGIDPVVAFVIPRSIDGLT